MEINIELEELRKRKLFVAAPMYGGQCAGMFCRSTNDLSAMAVHYGIDLRFYYLFNESLITRARNYCVDEFMRSDCTHMLFIDSDIGFDAKDVMTLLALMDDESEYDVLCGPYPKKCISWEKIKQAVDLGVADDDEGVIERPAVRPNIRTVRLAQHNQADEHAGRRDEVARPRGLRRARPDKPVPRDIRDDRLP